jgi:hypothetical protein
MTDLKTLWTNQKTEETVTLENIQEKAAKFQRRVYWGNTLEYAASVLVVVIFGWYVWVLPGWMAKLGSALIVVAILYIVWQLGRRGRAGRVPGGSALALVDFHRRELERRRDLLRSAWHWYILPVVPGIALILLGRWYQIHVPGRPAGLDHLIIILGGIVAALIIAIVRLIQVLAAVTLQRQIDELDKLK